MKTACLRVTHETAYDVVVVGGGPAGICAGLASARLDMKTLLVERTACLGGQMTSGLHPLICGWQPHLAPVPAVRGLAAELTDRVCAFYDVKHRSFLDPELTKYVAEQTLIEAGASILYDTFFIDVEGESDGVAAVLVANKSGLIRVDARCVVDCTADADVAWRAGADFEKGRPQDGLVQPVTLMCLFSGLDATRFWDWVGPNRSAVYDKVAHLFRQAHENGDVATLFQNRPMGLNTFDCWGDRPGDFVLNFTNLTEVDPTDGFDVSRAYVELRQQAWTLRDFWRKSVPGGEHCHLATTAALLGTRESRRICGESRLTVQDVLDLRKPDDSIARGCYAIDVHTVDPGGVGARFEKLDDTYGIPYGCLVPKGVRNLLVAGRCISVDHEALGSTRVMVTCMALGHAAGAAAALCVKRAVAAKDLNVALLRQTLRSQGGLL